VAGWTAGCWGAGLREERRAAAHWVAQTAGRWAMVAAVARAAVGMAEGGAEVEAGAERRQAPLEGTMAAAGWAVRAVRVGAASAREVAALVG